MTLPLCVPDTPSYTEIERRAERSGASQDLREGMSAVQQVTCGECTHRQDFVRNYVIVVQYTSGKYKEARYILSHEILCLKRFDITLTTQTRKMDEYRRVLLPTKIAE